MAAMTQKTNALLLSVALCGLLTAASIPVHADSTIIDGPGFKVEKKKGWFGRQSTVYQDALGNEVEKKTGWFGRKTTSTKLFGSQAVKNGNNLTVNGPNGKPLITRKKTLFGGEQTHVDGNGIFQSVKDLFK